MRLVLLLALCNCVTYPQIYALDCCEWSEKSGVGCEIRTPDDELMSKSSTGWNMMHFNGEHIRKRQHYVLGRGRSYCFDVMGGIELVPHVSGPGGYLCKCKEEDYMAFFGMCIPKLNGEDPKDSKVIDGVLIGRETDYARLLPLMDDDHIYDYSFFLPLIKAKGRRALYMRKSICRKPNTEHRYEKTIEGCAHDISCYCEDGYYMNRMGECVKECENIVDWRQSRNWQEYCLDEILELDLRGTSNVVS